MITTLLRIVKYGWQNFWRNSLVSIATILVTLVALLVFEGLILFGAVADRAFATLEDKIDISVYFKPTAPEDEILRVERALRDLKEVKGVEYVSREKALELFKATHQGDTVISQALEQVEENPLLASLNIKAHDPEDYPLISDYLSDASLAPLVEKVTFTQSRRAIELLTKLVNMFRKLGVGLAIFLSLTAALVTFNTVRLAIYSNREEIGIMRLVGASNAFINGPYFVVGIFYGLIAAVLSIAFAAPFVHGISSGIQTFIPEMNMEDYFYGNLLSLFWYQILFGIFLGACSSLVAVRRYLKI